MKAKKAKLSPSELEEKKAREALTVTINRIKSSWSFGGIKTFYDLQRAFGFSDKDIRAVWYPSELDEKLTFDRVKEICSDEQVRLDTFYWLKKNPPTTELTSQERIELDGLGASYTVTPITPEIVNPEVILKPPYDGSAILSPDETVKELKDYGIVMQPEEKNISFLWFQKKAITDALKKIDDKKRGILVTAGTGTGKTIIAGGILRRLINRSFHVGKTYTPWPYIYVTKASIVEQTKRDLEYFFGLTENDVLVINIDQLRSNFGQRFVNEICDIQKGEEVIKWKWRDQLYPVVIIWDECQALKNMDTKQSMIAQSYNDIATENTYQVFMSATPFTRVIETKCFAVATRIPYTYGLAKNAPLTNDHFMDFARNIASDYGRLDTKPEEHSPPAIDRFRTKVDDYVVAVKGVKSQFHAINTVQMIDFDTEEGRKFYDDAWERFLDEKAKIESSEEFSGSQARFNILAQLTIFRIAAESNPDRVRKLARGMWEVVATGKQVAVSALNFKISICKCVDILVNDFGVSRDDISLIWGGAPQPNKKQKLKAKLEKQKEAMDILESMGITMEDLDLDEIEAQEEAKLDPKLRLGAQSLKERQREIDRFQKGITHYCFYTFRAGGVGLSLHHTDKNTKEKVRHRESGYAVVEDIPNIPTKQRVVFVAPTYSAMELVQGLGRAPRITSLSDTPQVLMFYRNTIEERVARVVFRKLRCLSKVVRNKESWEDVVVGSAHESDEEIEKRHMREPTDEVAPESDDNGGEGLIEEDDEE